MNAIRRYYSKSYYKNGSSEFEQAVGETSTLFTTFNSSILSAQISKPCPFKMWFFFVVHMVCPFFQCDCVHWIRISRNMKITSNVYVQYMYCMHLKHNLSCMLVVLHTQNKWIFTAVINTVSFLGTTIRTTLNIELNILNDSTYIWSKREPLTMNEHRTSA